jgi:hypothetical protein
MILSFDHTFSITDVCNQLPEVSRDLVKKTLAKLKEQNQITPIGSGRSARWKRL